MRSRFQFYLLNALMLLLGALVWFAPKSNAQFIDRIVRPCSTGTVPLASVIVNPNSTGNVVVTPCTGGSLVIGSGTVPTISGSPAANQVTLWNSTTTITGDPGHVFAGTGNTFSITMGTTNATTIGTKITQYNGAAPLNGQLLIGNTAGGTFDASTLTSGAGITITNGGGSITITNSGGGGVCAGCITGSAANGQVALWSGASTQIGDAGFTYAGTGATFIATANRISIAEGVATSGSPVALLVTGGAHTTLATAEDNDVNLNLARTVQFTTGAAITNQRAVLIQAPTYSATALTQTITNAATLAVTGPPVAGTNMAFTNTYALWVQSGTVAIGGTAAKLLMNTLNSQSFVNIQQGGVTIPFLEFQNLGGTDVYVVDGAGKITTYNGAAPTNGQIPIGNGSAFLAGTITAGTGISVTNGAGSITIANTATGTTINPTNQVIPVRSNATTFIDSALTDNATVVKTSEPVDLTSKSVSFEIANEGVTGTSLNKLAKLTGAPSTAIIATAGDTSATVGVVVSGAGIAGNAIIAISGQVTCVFDGATTAGHFVGISASVAGDCTDAGASYPATGEVLGIVLSTNAAGGTFNMELGTLDTTITNGNGGKGGRAVGSANQFQYTTGGGNFAAANVQEESANLVRFRNGANAQEVDICDTFTDSNNFGCVKVDTDASFSYFRNITKSAGVQVFTGKPIQIKSDLDLYLTANQGAPAYTVRIDVNTDSLNNASMRPASGNLTLGTSGNRWNNTYINGFSPNTNSPASIGSNQNNYDWGSQNMFERLTSSVNVNITGIQPSSVTALEGNTYLVRNIGSNVITLTHEDASSLAANRFRSSSLANVAVGPDQAALATRDVGTQRFRLDKLNPAPITGRLTGQTAAATPINAYTVGGADSTFYVSANVNVTTSTTHNFTVTCTYTDEGNNARTLTLNFSQLAGTLITAITNGTGAGPYMGVPVLIRAKAATTISVQSTGTFTTVTYNVEGNLTQVNP